ncbi:MFS transporter [Lentzea alba]|uniref:MFS transporter n=1 Tax=Lentzea alba TaxID=2714351 RepID=UPI0039BF45A5
MSISAAPARQRTRNMSLLTAAQTLYQCCISVDLTLTGIVGLTLAPSPALATIPFALISIGSWLTTYPASAFMRRHGRRAGFTLGSLAAVVGGLISVLAVTLQSFPLFCAGVACIGVFQAFAGYYRYTAADISPADQRARAISTVLSGGILAAVAGPFLATAVKDVLPVVFAGSYALVTALGLASTAVVALMTVDHVEKAQEQAVPSGTPRTLKEIARQPIFLAGVAGAGAGYFTMTLAMTAAPLAVSGSGHSVHEAATVIQWHMVGMYATAFISGRLAARIGAAQTVLAGVVVNAAGALIALSGSSHIHFMIALALIGVGWNLMFVAGTTLLASSYLPHERSVTQGVSEMFTLGASALGALTAGPLLSATGWSAVNAFLLVPLAVSAVFAVLHLVKK